MRWCSVSNYIFPLCDRCMSVSGGDARVIHKRTAVQCLVHIAWIGWLCATVNSFLAMMNHVEYCVLFYVGSSSSSRTTPCGQRAWVCALTRFPGFRAVLRKHSGQTQTGMSYLWSFSSKISKDKGSLDFLAWVPFLNQTTLSKIDLGTLSTVRRVQDKNKTCFFARSLLYFFVLPPTHNPNFDSLGPMLL